MCINTFHVSTVNCHSSRSGIRVCSECVRVRSYARAHALACIQVVYLVVSCSFPPVRLSVSVSGSLSLTPYSGSWSLSHCTFANTHKPTASLAGIVSGSRHRDRAVAGSQVCARLTRSIVLPPSPCPPLAPSLPACALPLPFFASRYHSRPPSCRHQIMEAPAQRPLASTPCRACHTLVRSHMRAPRNDKTGLGVSPVLLF